MNQLLKKSLTDSKFQMWRGCMAIILIDGKIDPKEEDWIEKKLKLIPFSAEQMTILLRDIKTGVQLSHLIPLITDKRDRAFLLHNIRVLGHIDGHFDNKEKEAFKNLENQILKGLDLDAISLEIEEMEKESYNENEVFKVDNEAVVSERLLKSFMKFISPGDYKFPTDLF